MKKGLPLDHQISFDNDLTKIQNVKTHTRNQYEDNIK